MKSALASTLARMRRAFCIDWGSPKNLKKTALSRRASISGGGMMGASCFRSPLGEEVEAAFGAPYLHLASW